MTTSDERVEALAKVLGNLPGKQETETFGQWDRRRARAVLASDWLAADRARVRAETLAEVERRLMKVHRPDGGIEGPGTMCVECTTDFGTPTEEPIPFPCSAVRIVRGMAEAGEPDAR